MTYYMSAAQRYLDMSKPIIMGILNITTDSFYAGSRIIPEKVVDRSNQMIQDGADIIDLGSMSSRPGAEELEEEVELGRLLPAVKAIRSQHPDTIISIDTYRSNIVNELAEVGIDIVNDISSGEMDSEMFNTVAAHNLAYIMMHMRGKPQTMQHNTHYDDLILEQLNFFSHKISQARHAGVKDIIVDPGIGFGKTVDHNFQIIKHLSSFRIFDLPILLGLSRKSFIYKTLESTPEKALNGTTAMHILGLHNGAAILRAHDVKEAVECRKLYSSYQNSDNS